MKRLIVCVAIWWIGVLAGAAQAQQVIDVPGRADIERFSVTHSKHGVVMWEAEAEGFSVVVLTLSCPGHAAIRRRFDESRGPLVWFFGPRFPGRPLRYADVRREKAKVDCFLIGAVTQVQAFMAGVPLCYPSAKGGEL